MSDYRQTTTRGPKVSIDANRVVSPTIHPPGGYPINWWKVAFIASIGAAALWYVTSSTPPPKMPTGTVEDDGGNPSDDQGSEG
jgi:hypothetical protein